MMNNIGLRDATIFDAPILCAAEQKTAAIPGLLVSRPHELREEQFATKIKHLHEHARGKYIVAEIDGQAVGHAMLDPIELAQLAHVVRLTIVVHPGYLGKGIGTKLLQTLIEWARATEGVEKIELMVREGNQTAIHLYEKMGFKREGQFSGRIKTKDGRYIDDIAMSLWVKSCNSDQAASRLLATKNPPEGG